MLSPAEPVTIGSSSEEALVYDVPLSEKSLIQRGSLIMSVRDRLLKRHDSVFSVDSNYDDPSANDLTVLQGAALLTADCLGVGLLALPEDVKVLGKWMGLGFLILNLPINLYAGTILSHSAAHVEYMQDQENEVYIERQREVSQNSQEADGLVFQNSTTTGGNGYRNYAAIEQDEDTLTPVQKCRTSEGSIIVQAPNSEKRVNPHETVHHDTATFDFIGMTQALFFSRGSTRFVMALFYTNIFLVLGDYILVMSHAVSALVGTDRLCIPQAGILASFLMYALSQIRTMANLGRTATFVSLSALFVVVAQCLWAVHENKSETYQEASSEDFDEDTGWLRKFSALGSIGFAVGSQKLYLNIRHEMAERQKAPKSLAIAISSFGFVYVGIIVLAGSNPPSFLFDAIPAGWNRRLAGFLLWVHVAVSYAINSQALCASMDRLFFSKIETFGLSDRPRIRWMCFTALLSLSAFIVANAVPFFKDLVALIGALTSVPLCLHMPGIFYRRYLQVSIWLPATQTAGSYALLIFASAFMVFALAGAVSSIGLDWSSHSGPFACH